MAQKMSPQQPPKRLYAKIRWARETAGYSQEAFAAAVGTSRRHVIRWERAAGPTTPTLHYLTRIAEVTGRPVDMFTDEDEEEAVA